MKHPINYTMLCDFCELAPPDRRSGGVPDRFHLRPARACRAGLTRHSARALRAVWSAPRLETRCSL